MRDQNRQAKDKPKDKLWKRFFSKLIYYRKVNKTRKSDGFWLCRISAININYTLLETKVTCQK